MFQRQIKFISSWQNKEMQPARQALPHDRPQEGGWTLVELGVVLVVIGLLLGGVLYAEELYRVVQVRRVMSDINGISAATKGFQEKYGSIPGDFPLAQTRIPNCTVAASHCYNGNGDGFVGRIFSGSSGWDQNQNGTITMPQGETTMFFKHLALGHFLKDINPVSDPTRPQWSVTHPAAATGGGFTVFADTHSAGSSISIRLQNATNYSGQAIDLGQQRPYTVKQARYMDQKYDDGRANAGSMWGIPYAGAGAGPPCRKSWAGSQGEQYNMDPADSAADSRVCQFHYVFH